MEGAFSLTTALGHVIEYITKVPAKRDIDIIDVMASISSTNNRR